MKSDQYRELSTFWTFVSLLSYQKVAIRATNYLQDALLLVVHYFAQSIISRFLRFQPG
jgi:hypothetical protein